MFIYFSLKSQNIILYYLCFCLQLRRDCRVKLWNILSVIFHPSLRKSSCKWVKSRESRKYYQNHGKHIVKYSDECWVLGGSDLGVYGRTNFIDSVILWPLLCKLEPGLHCLWLNNCATWAENTKWSMITKMRHPWPLALSMSGSWLLLATSALSTIWAGTPEITPASLPSSPGMENILDVESSIREWGNRTETWNLRKIHL